MTESVLSALKTANISLSINSESELKQIIESGLNSNEFLKLVLALSDELRSICGFESKIHPISGPEDQGSLLMEIRGFLKEAACPYVSLLECPTGQSLSSAEQKWQLVMFLSSELQAAKMCAIARLKAKENEKTAADSIKQLKIQESEKAAVLRSMLQCLGFSKPPGGISPKQLFDKLQTKLKEQKGHFDQGHLGKPLFTGTLSDTQWRKLEMLNDELKAEYKMRAQMLLKRLDVTVQSFSWSERVKKMEGKLNEIYGPRRQQLNMDSRVGIEDLLAARDDLTTIEKTCGMTVRKNTQSRVQKVLMKGRMPDRGGRPTEIEPPPPEMPPWQKDRAPTGGGGGGRGGGGGYQRGGGDRGGGRVQRGGGGGYGGSSGGGYDQRQSYGGGGGYQQQQQNFAGGGYQQQQTYGGGGGGGYQQQQYGASSYQQGYNFQQAPGYQHGYSSQQQYYQHDDRRDDRQGAGRGRGGGRGAYGQRRDYY